MRMTKGRCKEHAVIIDVEQVVGAVTREVSSREHDGKLARVVVATRVYNTSADDLWDALTSAERLPRWFLPVSGDLRLGGRYQLKGNAGGTITRCEPPRSLAVTWEYDGSVSWVTVNLRQQSPERTELELEHMAHVDEHWAQYGPGAAGVGWDMALMGLERYIAGGASLDPQQFEQWCTSDEGRRFITRSSNDWGRASIAAGEPEGSAKAAADRTTSFYTGG
jgi:uncharacterized protein YndB with AHSA1/START domain